MATASPDIREKLASLGERRAEKKEADAKLAEDIEEALVEAKEAGVPKAEAARLLGVHRTTLYRVYDA